MDSQSKRSSAANPPSKSTLARSIAKALHIRALTEKSSDNDSKKTKNSKLKSQKTKKKDEDNDNLKRAVEEAFTAKLFASVSSIKAAYAQLQCAQSPYDAEAIQSSDQMVVSELKSLSEMKRCFLKNQLDEESPERALILAEIQEQSSVVKTYEVTAKKLDSQLKLKDSEVMFLKEKLAEVCNDVSSLRKRLSSRGTFVISKDITPSDLRPSHFIAFVNQTVKSVRSFVGSIVAEMESSNWDLASAADAIQPGIRFWESNHRVFAFESYVRREMFNGFNRPLFDEKIESFSTKGDNFFNRFKEMKSVRSSDYLTRKPESKFASFCRAKYLKLVHRGMEDSFFGNLKQRDLIEAGEFPETGFFLAFAEMAKRVWLLHCLAFSFDPEASIFEVAKGTRYSEVYMESLSDEAFASSSDPRVAFSVFPGFQIGGTVVQCQVYLC